MPPFLKYAKGYLGGFFCLLAIGCLLLSALFGRQSYTLLQEGERAQGVVKELDRRQGTSSRSGARGLGYVYAPIFEFKTPDGVTHVVRSSTWSDPPAFTQGEQVEVLYRAAAPNDAVINSFSQLWLTPLIPGSIGLVFGIVGIFCIVSTLRRKALETWLRQNGQRIPTDIQGAELNRRIKMNGQSPYQLVTTWKDPKTETVYTFKSDNLWQDPTTKLQGRTTIDVLIKPGDPSAYLMDLSQIGHLGS